jgi:hypothetical protein
MPSATTSFEIELDLSASITPGYAGDFYCPPYGPEVEDVEVEGVHALSGRWDKLTKRHVWDRTDLLAGVDTKNPEVQKLLANLIAFAGTDAAEAIMAEAA